MTTAVDTEASDMQKIKKRQEEKHQHKHRSARSPLHRVDKRRHTITVAVWQVQREQEQVDSDKTVPLSLNKNTKRKLYQCAGTTKSAVGINRRPGKVRLLWWLLLY